MNKIKLIPVVYLFRGRVLVQTSPSGVAAEQPEMEAAARENQPGQTAEMPDPVSFCAALSHGGADELAIIELSETDREHEEHIHLIQDIAEAVDIPLFAGGNVKRLEDIKKYLYAGAAKVILNMNLSSNRDLIREGAARFGNDKIAVYARGCVPEGDISAWKEAGATLMFWEDPQMCGNILPVVAMGYADEEAYLARNISGDIYGISADSFLDLSQTISARKAKLQSAGIAVFALESSLPFSEFRLNGDGLIPVIVQDYKTNEVLMLAYMNRESYERTLMTGRMTYYSRSRQELWEKGLTSGHFQYVKSLFLDCDGDTLLAKVYQVGAACHTGHRSCFFTTLLQQEGSQKDPRTVLETVYEVIKDRKLHPKEGSYTNYLFDKGLDKILKKVGEEASEIIIAAKNPDEKEVVYEISDFLYHMMVLMAEKNLEWRDITGELARR